MNKISRYIIIGLSFFIYSCAEDEDQNVVPQNQQLKGKWEAYTIKGDDEKLYSLNQEVPRYTFWGSCEIFNTKNKYQALSYNFRSDSNLTRIVKRTHFFRGWTFHDYPNSCELTFSDWSTLFFNDTTQHSYKRISNSKIRINNYTSADKFDTLDFQIINGKLQFPEAIFHRDVVFTQVN